MVSSEAQTFLNLLKSRFPDHKGPRGEVVCYLERRVVAHDREMLRAGTRFHLDRDLLQQWFREFCIRLGDELSHSQREVYARLFNQVIRVWVRAGLLAPARVRNYPRDKRPLVFDPEVLTRYRLSDFVALCRYFVARVLEQGRVGAVDDAAWDVYSGAVFALIALGGICWEGAFSAVANLRFHHLTHLREGAIVVPQPRGNESHTQTRGWVRVHLTPFVALCVGGAACHRARPPARPGLRKRPLRRMEPDAYLVPLRRGDPCIGRLNVSGLRRRFNRWLEHLCNTAGVPCLTVSDLARLARAYLFLEGVYPEPVLATLLGLVSYHPTPFEELNVFNSYRDRFELPPWGKEAVIEKGAARGRQSRQTRPSRPREAANISRAARAYKSATRQLQAVIRPAIHPGGDAAEVPAELRRFARAQFRQARIKVGDNLQAALRQVYASHILPHAGRWAWEPFTHAAVRAFNLAATALWLAEMVERGEHSPKTIAARRTDATGWMRRFPVTPFTHLDKDALDELAALDLAGKTRERARSSLRLLRRFLRRTLQTELPPITWSRWPRQTATRPVHMPSMQQISQLLGELAHGGTAMARNAYVAVLVAVFAGLRAFEITSLRIEDLVLRGVRYLEVWDGKFGHHRRVPLDDVPDEVIQVWKDQRKRRWLEAGKDTTALLLVREDGRPVSPDALSKHIIRTMDELGMRGDPDTGRPVDLHRLRAVYINRQLVQGREPGVVARLAGHATPGVTLRVYSYCWEWAQRECLSAYDDPRLTGAERIAARSLAALMDLTMQGAKEVIKGAKVEFATVDGARVKSVRLEDAARVVALETTLCQNLPLPGSGWRCLQGTSHGHSV